MKRSELYKTLELEYCKALDLVRNDVIEAMSSSPCYLGSEKYFEKLEKAILKTLKKEKNKKGKKK